MSGFVRYAGTLTPSDTLPTGRILENPYTAFKFDSGNATDTVVLVAADGTTLIPASEYVPGVWHHIEFTGIKDTDTDPTSFQVGRLVRTGIQQPSP